jgi:methylamine---glutamate N-methyltransferase subunit C
MSDKGMDEKEEFSAIAQIKTVADKGKSILSSMGSLKKMPFSLNDLHFVPAQISKIPLNTTEEVNTKVVIGPNAKKPLKVSSPIMFSGMSYGAVSQNVRLILAKVASKLDLGLNSGEDFVLQEEIDIIAKNLIVQYSAFRFGTQEEIIKKSSAVEIRFGQGAYPGWESLLPAEKVPPQIAKLMDLKEGDEMISPAHHSDIRNEEELKEKIGWLREVTGGVPIGAKIGCGNVENDVEVLVNGGVDFIALDGFGAGTGATEYFIRENFGIPIIAALPRADKLLKKMSVRNNVSLIVGGGLRTSSDFAKFLALGADAVYIGTSALIAINCQQYRVCHTGLCPTGVTTNDPVLTKRLDVEEGIRKLTNFIQVSNLEVANICRIIGKDDVKELGLEDLVALKKDLAEVTGVKWMNGKNA